MIWTLQTCLTIDVGSLNSVTLILNSTFDDMSQYSIELYGKGKINVNMHNKIILFTDFSRICSTQKIKEKIKGNKIFFSHNTYIYMYVKYGYIGFQFYMYFKRIYFKC